MVEWGKKSDPVICDDYALDHTLRLSTVFPAGREYDFRYESCDAPQELLNTCMLQKNHATPHE